MKRLPELPRRTIEELVLRYQLEPSMRDVFVEGHSDHTILRWFIDACCSDGTNVEVYPIDGVDVPVEVLNRYALSTGNRSEVVALCLELEQQLANGATCVTGVVDRDMDVILPEQCAAIHLAKGVFRRTGMMATFPIQPSAICLDPISLSKKPSPGT